RMALLDVLITDKDIARCVDYREGHCTTCWLQRRTLHDVLVTEKDITCWVDYRD
ncbi:hypothetical protein CHS0354_024796, partial [Potamilus streckersoni]